MFPKRFFIMAAIFLALDFTYIYFVKDIFGAQITNIQRVVMKFRPVGAIICYMFLLVGLWFFIVSRRRPVGEAALLGAVIYGTYDMTNYATLKKWDATFAAMDIAWGATLFGATTALTAAVAGGGA